jgi:hypothetical protein
MQKRKTALLKHSNYNILFKCTFFKINLRVEKTRNLCLQYSVCQGSALCRKNMRFFKLSEMLDADTVFMFFKALLIGLFIFFDIKLTKANSSSHMVSGIFYSGISIQNCIFNFNYK